VLGKVEVVGLTGAVVEARNHKFRFGSAKTFVITMVWGVLFHPQSDSARTLHKTLKDIQLDLIIARFI
jgi:hypothetical protein